MEFLATLLFKRKIDTNLIKLQTNVYALIGLSTITYLLYSLSSFGEIYRDLQEHQKTDPSRLETYLSLCNCFKQIEVNSSMQDKNENPFVKKIILNDTTCSSEAFKRGVGQKVIGFTFYEPDGENEDKSNREYFEGIAENLRLMKQFYPGYVMRLYFQAQDPFIIEKLCELSCRNPHLDLCDARNVPKLGDSTVLYPLLWRFLPVLDKQVDFFFSRDLDSRISQREVSAVEEFLSSDAHSFHVMRDHPAHSTYIMGGTWGIKVSKHRRELLISFSKLFKDRSGLAYLDRNKGGYDQVALTKYIWPWAKWKALSHDSYLCKKYSRTSPFPTKRAEGIGNYVGSVVSLNASLGFTEGSECPFKCRPKAHKDWIYC